MRQFLAGRNIECKCQHPAQQHMMGETCQSRDTRYWIKKTDNTKHCPCEQYRPSLAAIVAKVVSPFTGSN